MTDARSLEAAIAAAPDDAAACAAYTVYSDWLQQQGDPRGELIALMLAREAEQARGVAKSKLATAIARLMRRHAAAWLGPLAALPDGALTWRRGFAERAVLDGAAPAEALLGHPSGRFVRELAVRCDGVDDAHRLIDLLAERRPPLVELELTVRGQPAGELLELAALWPAALRRLAVVARGFDLGAIAAERAERVRLWSVRLSGENVRAVAAAPWPALQRLELRFAGRGEPSRASLADVQRLVTRGDLPALTHLKLRGCEHAGEALVALARAPLARQLVVIDLSYGLVESADLRALVHHKASFPALRELWLPASAWAEARPLLDGIAAHVLSDARGAIDTFEGEVG